MRWAYHSASGEDAPRWVDRGNSNAQTEARAVAQDILNDIKAQEKTDDAS